LQGQASGAWIEVNEEVYPDPPLTELPSAVLDDLSWLRDVISVTLLRHNTQSSVDNGLLFQAHQRIVAAGKFDPDEALVMQEGVVTILPPDTSVTVIEPSDPVALERRLKELDLEILQTAFYKDRYIPIDSRAVQSAESQIEEDVDYVTNMTRAGRRLEGFANELVRQWAAFKGQDWDNELKLNLDLTKEDFDAHVRVLATLWDTISQYERWKKEELKKVAANRNLNNVDEILEEIESGPDEAAIERQEAQRMQRWDNMRTQLLGKRNGAAAVEKDE
jgi:heme-degrading monooxygenase HmoA